MVLHKIFIAGPGPQQGDCRAYGLRAAVLNSKTNPSEGKPFLSFKKRLSEILVTFVENDNSEDTFLLCAIVS